MRVHGGMLVVAVAGAGLLSSASGMGCMEGGLNQNQQTPGNQDNGVAVGFGDIAIDPTGRWAIYGVDSRLQISDLATGARHRIDGLEKAERLAFGPAGSGALYVVAERDGAGVLEAIDLDSRRPRWSRPVTIHPTIGGDGVSMLPWVEPTPDGRFVVVTDSRRVDVLSAGEGREKQRLALDDDVMDVDVVPDSSRLLVTEWHRWDGAQPSTRITSLRLGAEDGGPERITVPNCSSELVLTPDARFAFLAPTLCRRDPVSVIDLENQRFLRNLPGFGPVAVAPDGRLAVAFLDATAVDASLFDDPSQIPAPEGVRYHLVLIDTATLAFDTVPIGDALPRYAITPDGAILLVDSSFWGSGGDGGRVRLLDVDRRVLIPLRGGADVRLESYVITSDAEKVFLLYGGLWRIDLASASLTQVTLPFTPRNLNITADDRTLVLREDAARLWLYDIARGTLIGSLDTRAAAAPLPAAQRAVRVLDTP